jgi:hypothetical protein
MPEKPELERIAFEVSSDHSGFEPEWPWALKTDDGAYVIDNSPWLAYGISAGDCVLAEKRDGTLRFLRVERRGGHSTYRVRLA